MRICLYAGTALPKIGGAEVVVDALARQFTQGGHEVVVLAPRPRRKWKVTDETLPYPVVRHPRFFSTYRMVPWYRRWLLHLCRRRRFDVVHCHGVYPVGYVAALCGDQLGCPLVITSAGGDVQPEHQRLQKPGIYARHVQALEAADVLIAISSFTRAGYERMCPHLCSRIVDIPNGVDVDMFAKSVNRPGGISADIEPQRYVLFVGRLTHRKGVDVLLKGLSQVPSDGRVQLVIAGDGDDRRQLESMSAELGVVGRVRFVGMLEGAEKIYLIQNALCLVTPSRGWEGLPLVVLEGLAAGQPVIGSQLPGIADLIEPGRTGFLVPPESPADLARTLTHVFQQPTQLASMRQHAASVAQRHSWQAVAAAHIQLFEALRS